MHAFRGTRLLHCKSIVDQLGALRWADFEAGLAALQASVHGEAEALLRKACGHVEKQVRAWPVCPGLATLATLAGSVPSAPG